MDALRASHHGLSLATQRLDTHATRLARMSVDETIDPAPELVGLRQAQIAFAANLQTLRRVDDALGSLLDAWA